MEKACLKLNLIQTKIEPKYGEREDFKGKEKRTEEYRNRRS